MLFVVQGFYRLVLHALLHLRLRHRYRRTMKMLLCVHQQYDVIVWVNKHKETCDKPSHRTTNKHGKPVTAWIAMRKDVTGKELTLTSWKTKIAKCRRARTIWTLCTRRTGETIPRTAKFGRNDNSRARSLHWESGNNHRYAIVGQLWQLGDPWWNSWIEVKFFALLLQSTNQRSKLVETTKTNRSK